MSNDKPCAIATVKFYANKHVEVELDTIRNITPRTLDIASHIMLKTYRGMKAAYLAEQHKIAREDKAAAEAKAIADEAAFHEAEDERLAEAALPEHQETSAPVPEVEEPEEEVDGPETVPDEPEGETPEEAEVPEESEIDDDEAANDPAESEDEPEVA